MWAGLTAKTPNAAFFKTVMILGAGIPFSCICPLIAPVVWIVGYIMASRSLRGPRLARLLSTQPHQDEMPAPPIIVAGRPMSPG
jgi:hypothetical protein